MATDDRRYYILDARSAIGNCALFWGPDGKGYTTQVDEAGLYTWAEASRERETDIPIHRDAVEKATVRHCRLDFLGRCAGFSIYDARKEQERRVRERYAKRDDDA